MEVSIRHAEPGDYAALHRIMTSPAVVQGTMQLPFQSAEPWRQRLAAPQEGRYALVACAGGEVVGNISLLSLDRPRRRHVGQIGMAVRDDWQGKGIGSALMRAVLELADAWLNLHRIELEVYADNAAAIALYRKFGFVVEGTLRDFAFRNGQYTDALLMARVRGR